MSKGPDLSAFPIPRKGDARPIASRDDPGQAGEQERGTTATRGNGTASITPAPAFGLGRPPPSGQLVATTVKLDEDRYLRLSEAGRPGPGRLKRRTTQEIMIEALDEWFERRGL